jgi:hypothetical protein
VVRLDISVCVPGQRIHIRTFSHHSSFDLNKGNLNTTEFMDTFDSNSFPVVNLSNDGWSTDDEATATCFCGAVQLVLVSLSIFKFFLWPVICTLKSDKLSATQETRINQPPYLPLPRLPQNRLSLLPIQYHRSRFPSPAHPRRRQSHNLQREQNDSCECADDKLLLQDVWDADVSAWRLVSWDDDFAYWDR